MKYASFWEKAPCDPAVAKALLERVKFSDLGTDRVGARKKASAFARGGEVVSWGAKTILGKMSVIGTLARRDGLAVCILRAYYGS